jgi:hypothetical protein
LFPFSWPTDQSLRSPQQVRLRRNPLFAGHMPISERALHDAILDGDSRFGRNVALQQGI